MGRPRQEKSPTTRNARNDFAHFSGHIEGPGHPGAPNDASEIHSDHIWGQTTQMLEMSPLRPILATSWPRNQNPINMSQQSQLLHGTTSGAPVTREEPSYKTCSQRPCLLFLDLITNESPTTSGAPTTREEPSYKTCSQRPCSLFFEVDNK